MSRPLVKRAEDPYDKPLFPPKLEWFDIFRGDNPAGEILAAFELFQVKIAVKLKWAYSNRSEDFNPLPVNVFHHMETSQLICNANSLTGFYSMRNIVVMGL